MSKAPERISIKDEGYRERAIEAFVRDGSVILTDVFPTLTEEDEGKWADRAATIPELLWSPSELLLKKHTVAGVHLEHSTLDLLGKALPPHTDGYVWGDAYPDIVILYCESTSNSGGENFLVDGEELLENLEDESKTLLTSALVDHTERKEDGSVADGAESITPVLRWRDVAKSWFPGKRLCMRRMVKVEYVQGIKDPTDQYISLWKPTDDDETGKVQETLMNLDRQIAAQANEAARFRLSSGETLLVDNFRMFHARDAYSVGEGDTERRMWRIWSWTNASFGLPPDVNHENIAASPMQVEVKLAKA